MLWFVLAIFTSPFLAILMIACIGETDEKRKERIIQEEEWRNMYCRKSNQDEYKNSNRVESRQECKTEQREYKGQVTMDQAGYLCADETTRTNLPGVFAAGDVRTKPLRQVVTAAADGAVAAHFAEQYLNEQKIDAGVN